MANSARIISSRSIASQIRSRILLSGPIPVAEYMRMSLTQPSTDILQKNSQENAGYYMKQDVFGSKGDFITSPEITQMFGELIGVWGVQCWKQLRGPDKFNVVELGPGRGTLSRDMLRVFEKFDRVIGKDVALNLVEISPHLSKLQHQLLCIQEEKLGGDTGNKQQDSQSANNSGDQSNSFQSGLTLDSKFPVTWYKDIRDLPKEFSFYVAHEFFDALPVHKLQKVDKEWREILVDVNPDVENGFRFVVSRNETPVLKVLKTRYPKLFDTDRRHLEISLDGLVILEELSSRLEAYGGIAVIIDYGHEGTKDDTFRAFSKHQLHDPLVDPGTADLTADVDFSIIKQLFQENALICGPVTQHDFLEKLGIDLRLENLLKSAKTEEEREQLESGYNMIMKNMGARFYFLGMFPKVLEQFLPRLKFAGFH